MQCKRSIRIKQSHRSNGLKPLKQPVSEFDKLVLHKLIHIGFS